MYNKHLNVSFHSRNDNFTNIKMKLTFNRKAFQSALKIGGSYAGSSKVLPILGCVKINVANSKCWITSYDQQNAIKVQCDIIEAESDLQFCIDSVYIQKYLACLNEEEVELDVDFEKLTATITAGTSTTQCPVEKADEYPSPVNDKEAISFKIDAAYLLYWMSKGISFLKDDEFAQYNGCFHLMLKNGVVEVFATELVNMYHAKIEIDTDIEATISIHKTSFKGVMLALKDEQEVTVRSGEKNIVIMAGTKMLLIRKREFKVPPYDKLLKFIPKFKVRVNRDAIIAILQRSSLVHENAKIGVSTFEFTDNGIGITTLDYATNKKTDDFIKVEGGSIFKQNYNTQHILTAIMGISSEEIELAPTGEKSLLYVYNCDDEDELTATCPFA